jgi:hypothetical protein
VANEQTFDVLLKEFRRVGVDPDTFSAMLALRPEDALRALQVLPENAGATAFIAQLRKKGHAASAPAGIGAGASTLDQRRRDRSA